MAKRSSNPHRLDRRIAPVSYAVELEPDLASFRFRGRVSIEIAASEAFSSVTLNALDLKVSSAVLRQGSERVSARRIDLDPKRETVTIAFGRSFPAGKGMRLEIEFEGELNDRMHGFYRTSYQTDGQKRWGAATQFEATDARRAFPCWDEPDRKARFDVTLIVPKGLVALSNMPVISEEPAGADKKRLVYATTPVMPTYLLAVVVAELEYVEARAKAGTLVRVYTTPGKKEQGRFALEVALHTLPYFAGWFGIPYALPKLDMVALPDFASGAMENWGLVTYRETALLVDPVNSSAAARQRVAEVIDHELAHQWFGNLVTMEWWTDLWLNEGFASYMGPKAVDHQFPEWDIWKQFIVMDHLTALHDDSLRNTHPIEIEVKNPHEIREIFDHITYSKGSVVNRMLEHYLGEKVFRRGLRAYLKRFAYGNARTADLWAALEKASGKPVRAIMASYTRQGGYPVLTVSAGPGGRTLELTQKRFLFDGSTDRRAPFWKIPVGLTGPRLAKPHYALMERTRLALRPPASAARGAWFKLNPGQSGFYRTAYPPAALEALTRAVAVGDPKLTVIDRLGILDDALALARAGRVRTGDALSMLAACGRQTDYNVWVTVIGGLRTVENLLENPALRDRFRAFARGLLGPAAARAGWSPRSAETHSDILLRGALVGALGHFGDERLLRESRSRFEAFAAGAELDPNLRGAVYANVASAGDGGTLEKLLDVYRRSPLQEERVRVLRALTRYRGESQIDAVHAFAFSPDVRAQDTFIILAGFGSNVTARGRNWDFIRSRWPKLIERYKGSSVTLLGRILEGAVSGFIRETDLAEVRRFFGSHPVQGTERTMRQSLEVIACQARWAPRAATETTQWLAAARLPTAVAATKPPRDPAWTRSPR